jgi:cadmium resistance protein CadD (predicted permease)
MLKRIAGFVLILLGALVTLFFRHYTGTIIPYPWLCLLLGLASLATGIYLVRASATDEDKTTTNKLYQAIADLKSTGERIEVDFSACSIRTSESLESDPGKAIDLDFLIDQ